jgi:hypothetical protein
MLTQDEIERARSLVAGGLDDIGDIKTLKKIADQAVTAIDLAAENERLKAKLDAVRAECNKAMLVKNPLKHKECLVAFGDKLNAILAIIKDGDNE